MRTIYKPMAVLLATTVFASVLSAQTANHEQYREENGVGYNKYLVSTLPNENGEYTLRLEAFFTGDVRKVSVPTDFILLLDNSGSMNANYYIDGDEDLIATKNYLSETSGSQLLVPDDGIQGTHYAYRRSSDYGSAGETVEYFLGASVFDSSDEEDFDDDNRVVRFYHYVDNDNPSNNGYYRIRRYVYEQDKKRYLNLRFKLKDGNYRYLWGTGLRTTAYADDEKNRDGRTDREWRWIDGASQEVNDFSNTIIYTGGNIYRYRNTRRDELLKGVDAFVDLVAADNAADHWAAGVTKNQIALVAFGYPCYLTSPAEDGRDHEYYRTTQGYMSSEDDITEYSYKDWGTKVIKSFTEASNAAEFKNAVRNRMNFCGGTSTDCGVHLAMKLFENLQTRSGMVPLNEFGAVSRNKVVILFTDGEPSRNDFTYYDVISPSLADARTIKTERSNPEGDEINGQVYCINFCAPGTTSFLYAEPCLQHLSSDYPLGDISNEAGSSASEVVFSGTEIADPHYYLTVSGESSLSEVFTSIGEASINQNSSTETVMVDKMSESFKISSNLSGKVKFYTAQCIGKKAIDGSDYLAFASEIPAPDRSSLDYLWVSYEDADGILRWTNKGAEGTGTMADIDNTITYSVSADNKTMMIRGFNYGDLWCGLDNINSNTRHEVAPSDPNYNYQIDGYRGFKVIAEFPIVLVDGIVGGLDFPTNDESVSGLYPADENGNPTGPAIINYPTPELTVPITLIIQKTGLAAGESASFTVQRKRLSSTTDTWKDYTSFILTGTENAAETPEVRLLNLNPEYYYRVKETGWSWSYTSEAMTTFPSTEDPSVKNPIVISNSPKETTIKHAEAKATNILKE